MWHRPCTRWYGIFQHPNTSNKTRGKGSGAYFGNNKRKLGMFITSAEREVKNSRRSEMYQIRHFLDKIRHVKSVGFRFYLAIWRSESQISSRCLEITSISLIYSLKEQYLVAAMHFWLGCREIKRCEESKRTSKSSFASRLVEFDTTLKVFRITDQWYIVPVEIRFGRNRDFLALLLLPLAGGPKDGKRFYAVWRLISSASFHTEIIKYVEKLLLFACLVFLEPYVK